MLNTQKKYKNKGGKVIASGGYGCVFNPGLKCEGESKRTKNRITKLMTDKHATQEYEEINNIKEKVDSIPNYNDYFLVDDVTLCRPSKLTATDLEAYTTKCTALPKNDITKKNINTKLDTIMALNLPNGGIALDDYIYENGDYLKLYNTHMALMKLLKKGIIPLNQRNIYHSDIKDSNILIDHTESSLKARLIDWGLTVEYIPGLGNPFPQNWRNRPLQFNVPFSVIIFTDLFYREYTEYLRNGGAIDEASLKPFVIDYIHNWLKERGAGHYKFINEIIFKLYSRDLHSIPEEKKPEVVETEITMPCIIGYIIDILVHYTKFKDDGSLNLREYLDNVYIHKVDIWGFISAYYPFLEMFSNNYATLDNKQLKIFKQLQFIFYEFIFKPRHEPYNIANLIQQFKALGNLIHIVIYNKRKTTSSASPQDLARGIKTRKNIKNKINKKSLSIFKRKPLKKHFKNPFLLSLK
jgi:serine/threonine protein kinase